MGDEWITADEAIETAALMGWGEPEPKPEPNGRPLFSMQTLEDFAGVDELGVRALVGSSEQALIPESGNVMLYGDGGTGKTTLCVDLACHLAAGDPWLGIEVEQVRSLLIEDEGPRAFFRRKLARKLASWAGAPLEGRVHVIERPWARFTFADETHRAELAEMIDLHELGVVFVGPVVVAGMAKAGTLQDVRDFLAQVNEVRSRTELETVTFVLVHHENKGGTVSGAWEGAGDTLLHVSAQGVGASRLHVQKARQAPDFHRQTFKLKWLEASESYEIELDEEAVPDEEIERVLLEAVGDDPGAAWSTIERQLIGRNERRRAAVDRLLELGLIVNIGRDGAGEIALAYRPNRTTTRLFRSDDPTVAHLLPARREDDSTLF